ncbi:MAG TPA: phosphonate ABC transporter, permease protein PhnE, partial [Candidatus Limnocylindria bacterium]|nr:phosphonate ABC transporter, permease protein PhnE [Candidatus Limnocylindria bacterium]
SPLIEGLGLFLLGLAAVLWLVALYLRPVPVTLPNGHSVPRPRSRVLLALVFLVPVVGLSLYITDFDAGIIVRRGHFLTGILGQIFQPNFDYFNKVGPPLVDTIRMSLVGSAVGSFLSLPFAVLASANINSSKVVLSLLRIVINVVRTLPTLIIASVSMLIFGLGTFAGTVAIGFFTFGVVAKMLYESIETIDMGPFEAMQSLGASRFQAFWSALMPQILPTYLSHALYSFEMNIRAASILGYVGAGGLGILIAERVGWRDYQGLGTVLLALFVTVLLIDNLSGYLRRKLS